MFQVCCIRVSIDGAFECPSAGKKDQRQGESPPGSRKLLQSTDDAEKRENRCQGAPSKLGRRFSFFPSEVASRHDCKSPEACRWHQGEACATVITEL